MARVESNVVVKVLGMRLSMVGVALTISLFLLAIFVAMHSFLPNGLSQPQPAVSLPPPIWNSLQQLRMHMYMYMSRGYTCTDLLSSSQSLADFLAAHAATEWW